MARCESLRSRAGDPLAIEMVELEQEELEQRQRETLEQMLLSSPNRGSSKATNDPIDFFGAIRNLVETNIPPEDIEKYTPVRDHPLHPGAFDAYMEAAARAAEEGASDSDEDASASHKMKIVQDQQEQDYDHDHDHDLRAENSLHRERLSEVELALQQAQEHSHRLLSEVETALDKANADLRAARDTAARDMNFQASRFNAESAIARANSEAAIAQLGEEFRLFREKTALAGGDDALLRRAQGTLAAEREQFSAFKRAVEQDRQQQEEEVREKTRAVAAADSVRASLEKERQDFRIFRDEVTAREGAEVARSRALQEAVAVQREEFTALEKASEATRGKLEADLALQAETLAREREEIRAFRERAAELEKEREARLLRAEKDLAQERERVSALQRENEASRSRHEAELAKVRREFRAFRDRVGSGTDERVRKAEEDLAEERRRFSVLEQAAANSQRERAADAEARLEAQAQQADASRAAAQAAEAALSKEREEFRAFRDRIGDGTDERVRKVEEDLAEERRRFSALEQAAADSQRKRAADAEARLEAQAQQADASRAAAQAAEAALSKEREEFRAFRESSAGAREALRRAEVTLAAERKQFLASTRTSAAKIELLRREATRVEDLEDQLASKGLRLKQKEAEARALATDGNVVRGLRESLTCKDNALNELRQELGNLRVASAADAAPQPTMAAKKQHQQQQQNEQQGHHSNAASYGENNVVGWAPPSQPEAPGAAGAENAASGSVLAPRVEPPPVVDMTRTLSMSSMDSFGEGSGLGAIAEEEEEEEEENTETEEFYGEQEEEEEEDEEVSSESEIETEEEEMDMEMEGGELGAVHEEEEEMETESDRGEETMDSGDEAMSVVLEGEEGEESDEEEDGDMGGDDASSSGGGGMAVECRREDHRAGEGEPRVPTAAGGADDGAGARPSKAVYGLRLDAGAFAEDQAAAESYAAAKFTAAAMLDEDEEDDGDDDEEENELERRLSAAGSGRRTSTGRRLSMSYSLSPGPRSSLAVRARASIAPGSKSLSPVPRRGDRSRASWSPGPEKIPLALGPAAKCLSPMARLAPADHGMGAEGNVVVLELGAWRVRAGVVSRGGQSGSSESGGGEKSYFDEFPCCVARPSKEGADLDELVNGASSLAAPMYSKFRETGVFVGGDAWYCCLDHPSIPLRSQLRLSCPLQHGKALTREDTDRLVDHAFGLLAQDCGLTPTLLTYKPTATVEEVLGLASVLLEAHRVPAIRMVNEAQLIALAVEVSNGVLVDIGESGLSVTPIYDGCPVAPAVRFEPCGGADVTKFLDYMLLSRTNEQFNQMTDRRRLEYTREIKEEQCYVPLDFEMEVDEYGAFKRKAMRVCKGAQASPMLSDYEACDSRDFGDEADKDEPLTKTQTFTLKSGDELDVQVGRERFHAPEILFKPGLWKEGGVSRSLAEVVLDAVNEVDSTSRAEMLEDIVVVGGSAHLDGLGDRLEEDLKALLPEWMGDRVDVRVPAADEFKHRNPLSRGIPSAVTVGAEMLLDGDKPDGKDWITATAWAENPDLLARALVPFLRGDDGGGRSVSREERSKR